MKSFLVRPIWITCCLMQFLSAIVVASEPQATISLKELGKRWPDLVANYFDKGANIRIQSAELGTANDAWIQTRSTSYTMHVQLVVRSCYVEGFETADVHLDTEGWSDMPQDQVVTDISNETWSKIDQFLKTHQIAASKTTTTRRWEDGRFASAQHSCEIQLSLKDADKLLEILKIYFEALPDRGMLHVWQH
jgi:hypothetical protein